MGSQRVPENQESEVNYIDITDQDLTQIIPPSTLETWERLGLEHQDATDWHDWNVKIKGLIALKNNPATRTPVVIKNTQDCLDGFREFARPLLNIMAASRHVTSRDEQVYNFVAFANKAKPSEASQITDRCIPTVKQHGGGVIDFACHTEHDASRASVGKGADGSRIAYIIVDQPKAQVAAEGEPELSPIPQRTIISSPDECTVIDFFPGASFTIKLDLKECGRNMQYFLQYYNSKHKDKAGPWEGPFSINIA